MSKRIVVFQNPSDILEFVRKVEKYPYDMDMKPLYRRREISAGTHESRFSE